jgi:hypothetical protein
LLRPAIAFREQGHRQEHRRGSGRKPDPNYKISVGAEAPFQCRAYIVNVGAKRRSLLPLMLNFFKQSPIVFGMPPGKLLQFTALDHSRESINPSRLQQPKYPPSPVKSDVTSDFATRFAIWSVICMARRATRRRNAAEISAGPLPFR